jgi:glycerophosphoryl diester phosphodiesterase
MRLLKAILATVTVFCVSSSYAYSPKIMAHRGGKSNFPENTIYAFEQALQIGSDGLEIDVQVTKDEIVVLYHPHDLSVLTNGSGPVSAMSYKKIYMLDAAYNFDPSGDKLYPERGNGHRIPTLSQVLEKFPDIEIIVDLKSVPTKSLIDAVIRVVNEKNAWDKLIFYSTNDEHLQYLKQVKPYANLFESRKTTRQRLLSLRNEGLCCCKDNSSHFVGFELAREMVVEESFMLGTDRNKIRFKLWDQKAVECAKETKGNDLKIYLFGINKIQDYNEAKKLGAYAIFTDTPSTIIKQLQQSESYNRSLQ